MPRGSFTLEENQVSELEVEEDVKEDDLEDFSTNEKRLALYYFIQGKLI